MMRSLGLRICAIAIVWSGMSCESSVMAWEPLVDGLELGTGVFCGLNPSQDDRSGFSVWTATDEGVRIRMLTRVQGAWRMRSMDFPRRDDEWSCFVRGELGDVIPLVFRKQADGPSATRVMLVDRWSGDVLSEYYLPELGEVRPYVFSKNDTEVMWVTLAKSPGLWRELTLSNGKWTGRSVRTAPPEYGANELKWGRWAGQGNVAYSQSWRRQDGEDSRGQGALAKIYNWQGDGSRSASYFSEDRLELVFGPDKAPDDLKRFRRYSQLMFAQSLLGVGEDDEVKVYVGLPLGHDQSTRFGVVAEWQVGHGWKAHDRKGIVGLGQALALRDTRVYALGAIKPEAWDRDDLAFDYIYEPYVDLVYCLTDRKVIPIRRLTPPFLFVNMRDGLYVWGRSGSRLLGQRVAD